MADAASATLGQRLAALRLPFLTVSVFPFLTGTLVSEPIDWIVFTLGLTLVVCTHLSANLINDYSDSKSGADWHDPTHFGLFGGSKIIQQGTLPAQFFLRTASGLTVVSAAIAIALTIMRGDILILIFFLLLHFWGWAYTQPPLKLAYRRLGELTLFVLCGPAVTIGGRYLQTGRLIELPAILVSIPYGFMIAIVLFTNEVPDYPDDIRSGKRTLVSVFRPQNAWLFHLFCTLSIIISVAICTLFGALSPFSLLTIAAAPLAFWAAWIMMRHHDSKPAMIPACILTVLYHAAVSLVIIVDTAIWVTW